MTLFSGLKTLLLMPLIGVFSYKFQSITGVALTPEQQLALAAGLPTGAALALRFVSTSPVFAGVRNWISKPKTVELSIENTALLAHSLALKMSPTVVMGVEKVLARRIAEAQAKQAADAAGVKTGE